MDEAGRGQQAARATSGRRLVFSRPLLTFPAVLSRFKFPAELAGIAQELPGTSPAPLELVKRVADSVELTGLFSCSARPRTMQALRLPFELQYSLSFQAIRPTASLPFRVTPFRRYLFVADSSDHSLPLNSDLADSPELPPALSIFESSSREYDKAPLSTLDFPRSPRSPRASLLLLIRNGKAAEADSLLRDLRKSSQEIEPDFQFARHAAHLYKNEPSSPWLDWWSLAPSLPARRFADKDVDKRLLRDIARHERFAEVILDDLLEKPGEVDRVREFGLLLAKGGAYQVVADKILVHFAASGNGEAAEELWLACSRALRHHRVLELELLTKRKMASERKAVKRRGWKRNAADEWMDDSRVESFALEKLKNDVAIWWSRAVAWLHVRREQMLRAHATAGRLEIAAELLPSTGQPHVRKRTYLYLLSLTAKADRFDLFQYLYAAMEKDGGRLVRARKLAWRTRTPYLARSIGTHLDDPIPHPQEAFVTFRYSTFSSELEEPLEEDYVGEASTDAAILEAIKADDLPGSGAILLESVKSGRPPSLDVTSQFITLARLQGRHAFLESISSLFQGSSAGASWIRGYWATAAMLARIKEGKPHEAVVLFSETFDLRALPVEVQTAVFSEARPTPDSTTPRSPPDAHTLSIALEALVPLLSLRPTPDALPLLDSLYTSLLSPTLPLLRRPLVQSLSSPPPASPLNPYTFLPFLRAFAHLQRPPIALLQIVADMQDLGLPCPKQHWGVVLGAYARYGDIRDLVYLLDVLERREAELEPSVELREMLERIEIPEKGPDLVAYTNVVAGLGTRDETIEARKVWERVAGSGMKVDKRLERAMWLLSRKDGRGLGSIEVAKIVEQMVETQ